MKTALILALLLLALAVPASGISPSRWSRVPESAFRSFPAVPGSAGCLSSSTAERHAGLCAAVEVAGSSPALASSILPTARPTGHTVPPFLGARGVATWQPLPGLWASAGPKVRAWGVKPGDRLTVCAGSRCVTVRVWPGGCWCPDRHGVPVLLDLSLDAFSALADPGLGVLPVVVTWR